MLALKDGKTTYRMGDEIVLDLSFAANDSGFAVNTLTEPHAPIDEITISPTDGVYSWLEDMSRGHSYSPDHSSGEELPAGTPLHILLPPNAVYRIDRPGHYSVHVTTHRAFRNRPLPGEPVQPGPTREADTTENGPRS